MTSENRALEMELASLIREVVNGDSNAVETGAIADEVLDRIWSLYESGELWVMWWIRKYCREGIRRRVCQLVKMPTGTILLSGTGTVVDMPTHVGVTTHLDDGLKAYQLKLWWELSWDEFLAMVAHRMRQRRILTREVRAFNEVASLRDRFPASKTPGEACTMAGIDPTQFQIDDELSG